MPVPRKALAEAAMPGIDYRQLRQQISIGQVLDLLDFHPSHRRGSQLRGPCPIPGCHGTSPRCFSAHLTRHIYHCFACGSHGNSLDLWSDACQLPLHAAALHLCQAIGLTPPWLPSPRADTADHQPRRVADSAPSRNR